MIDNQLLDNHDETTDYPVKCNTCWSCEREDDNHERTHVHHFLHLLFLNLINADKGQSRLNEIQNSDNNGEKNAGFSEWNS